MVVKEIKKESELVKVYDAMTGETFYKGKQENEELKNEKWKYDKRKGHYVLNYFSRKLIKEKV